MKGRTLASWVLFGAWLGGCGSGSVPCKLRDCQWENGASVVFEHDGWSDTATYAISVHIGDASTSCSGTLGDMTCDDDVTFRVEPGELGPGGIFLAWVPEAFTVVIERDGVIQLDQDFQPEPEVDYPNGEECPPECESWSTAVGW